jgi:hypothetical protein
MAVELALSAVGDTRIVASNARGTWSGFTCAMDGQSRDLAEAATGHPWASKMISYAIEPEAGYELMRTEAMLFEITYPSRGDKAKTIAHNAYHLVCNFCPICTWTERDVHCPLYNKELIYFWTGD